jgi:hypothetical protein
VEFSSSPSSPSTYSTTAANIVSSSPIECPLQTHTPSIPTQLTRNPLGVATGLPNKVW